MPGLSPSDVARAGPADTGAGSVPFGTEPAWPPAPAGVEAWDAGALVLLVLSSASLLQPASDSAATTSIILTRKYFVLIIVNLLSMVFCEGIRRRFGRQSVPCFHLAQTVNGKVFLRQGASISKSTAESTVTRRLAYLNWLRANDTGIVNVPADPGYSWNGPSPSG